MDHSPYWQSDKNNLDLQRCPMLISDSEGCHLVTGSVPPSQFWSICNPVSDTGGRAPVIQEPKYCNYDPIKKSSSSRSGDNPSRHTQCLASLAPHSCLSPSQSMAYVLLRNNELCHFRDRDYNIRPMTFSRAPMS